MASGVREPVKEGVDGGGSPVGMLAVNWQSGCNL